MRAWCTRVHACVKTLSGRLTRKLQRRGIGVEICCSDSPSLVDVEKSISRRGNRKKRFANHVAMVAVLAFWNTTTHGMVFTACDCSPGKLNPFNTSGQTGKWPHLLGMAREECWMEHRRAARLPSSAATSWSRLVPDCL